MQVPAWHTHMAPFSSTSLKKQELQQVYSLTLCFSLSFLSCIFQVLGLLLPTNVTQSLLISSCPNTCPAERRDFIQPESFISPFLVWFLCKETEYVCHLSHGGIPWRSSGFKTTTLCFESPEGQHTAVMEQKRPEAIQQWCNLLTENSNPL